MILDQERLKTLESNLSFVEDSHSYRWCGTPTRSVTQILTEAGITDYSKVPPDILQRAEVFGHAGHLMTRYEDEGRLNIERLDASLIPYLNGWRKFKEQFVKQMLLIEQRIYCPIGPYCGGLDRLYLDLSDDLCLLEIKTTSDFMPGVDLQTAAYHFALERTLKVKIKRRQGVLLLPNDFDPYYFDRKSDVDDFLACVRVVNYKNSRKMF